MFLEIRDGGLPLVQCGWNVSEQILECCDEVCRFSDVNIEDFGTVLVQDGALWCLEEGIVKRVSRVAFFLYGPWKVVVYVLRFPVASGSPYASRTIPSMTMRFPAAVCIGYCGMSVAFICFAQACKSVSKGELTAPSCVMPCCAYCCSVA